MSLDSDRWGNAIADEVSVSGLEASEQTSIRAFWKKVTSEHVLEISSNALVTTTSGAPNSEHSGNVS